MLLCVSPNVQVTHKGFFYYCYLKMFLCDCVNKHIAYVARVSPNAQVTRKGFFLITVKNVFT